MLSKRSVFSTAIKLPLTTAADVDVPAAGQYGPSDAQFIRNGHHHLIAGSTLGESVHPLPEACRVALDAKQHGAGTVDQHATQIDVTAFADTESFC